MIRAALSKVDRKLRRRYIWRVLYKTFFNFIAAATSHDDCRD